MEKKPEAEFATEFRNVITKLIKKLRKESPTGQQLSVTERSTMSLLNQHKSLFPGELANMEMITNQSMSQVLNHLSELGYITKAVSEADKRKVNVSLSLKGEETLKLFRQERDEWLAYAIAASCTEEDQEILKKAILPINKIIDFKNNI